MDNKDFPLSFFLLDGWQVGVAHIHVATKLNGDPRLPRQPPRQQHPRPSGIFEIESRDGAILLQLYFVHCGWYKCILCYCFILFWRRHPCLIRGPCFIKSCPGPTSWQPGLSKVRQKGSERHLGRKHSWPCWSSWSECPLPPPSILTVHPVSRTLASSFCFV